MRLQRYTYVQLLHRENCSPWLLQDTRVLYLLCVVYRYNTWTTCSFCTEQPYLDVFDYVCVYLMWYMIQIFESLQGCLWCQHSLKYAAGPVSSEFDITGTRKSESDGQKRIIVLITVTPISFWRTHCPALTTRALLWRFFLRPLRPSEGRQRLL